MEKENKLPENIEQAVDAAIAVMLRNTKSVMTLDECAEYTGYSKKTLQNITSGREMPFYKCRGRIFFKRDEVEQWLTAERIPSHAEIASKASLMALKRAHR